MESFLPGVPNKRSEAVAKLLLWKTCFLEGGNLPKPTSKQQRQEAPASTYINNISQLLERKISTTDWLAGITLSLNELSRHLTFESFSPNEYVGSSTTWMGFGFFCPMCYSQMNDAASITYNLICIYILNSKLTLALLTCTIQYFSIKLLNLPGKNAGIFLFISLLWNKESYLLWLR